MCVFWKADMGESDEPGGSNGLSVANNDDSHLTPDRVVALHQEIRPVGLLDMFHFAARMGNTRVFFQDVDLSGS
jgi:hypothetical protein